MLMYRRTKYLIHCQKYNKNNMICMGRLPPHFLLTHNLMTRAHRSQIMSTLTQPKEK